MSHTIEFGTPSEHRRALIVRGTSVNDFLRRETAHPNTVLVTVNRTPNDVVWTDKFQDATQALRGGFKGWFCTELPFAELNETHDEILYENLSLGVESAGAFKEAYNQWVKQTQAKK